MIRLRKDNTTIESQLHYKEKNINQLQTRVAVLEQEIKDKTMVCTCSMCVCVCCVTVVKAVCVSDCGDSSVCQ